MQPPPPAQNRTFQSPPGIGLIRNNLKTNIWIISRPFEYCQNVLPRTVHDTFVRPLRVLASLAQIKSSQAFQHAYWRGTESAPPPHLFFSISNKCLLSRSKGQVTSSGQIRNVTSAPTSEFKIAPVNTVLVFETFRVRYGHRYLQNVDIRSHFRNRMSDQFSTAPQGR